MPKSSLSNEELLSEFPDLKKTKLQKLGIESRKIERELLASDLAIKAAQNLFSEHPGLKNEIDFLLFCSQEFDYYTPTTACIIQAKLALNKNCGAIDYNLGCSGYPYGVLMAKGLVESGQAKKVLLLTASTLTKTFNPKDSASKIVFGDAAAASIIEYCTESKIGHVVFGSDGTLYKNITVEYERKGLKEIKLSDFHMDGLSVFSFSLDTVPDLISKTLEKNKIKMNEIDFFVFHQANAFLLEQLRKKINIPEEKFTVELKETGNTVSSSIPIAIKKMQENGISTENKKVLIAGFGTGMSWAATVVQL